MNIHLCSIDKVCRSVDAPPRLHIRTGRGNYAFALWPSAKFAMRNEAGDFEMRWTYWRRTEKSGSCGGSS